MLHQASSPQSRPTSPCIISIPQVERNCASCISRLINLVNDQLQFHSIPSTFLIRPVTLRRCMSDALGGRRWAWIHLCKHPITDPLRYQRVDEREVLGHLLKVITYSWATIYCTSWQEENRMLWDRDDWGRSSSCVIIEQIFFYESCVTWAMFLMNGLYPECHFWTVMYNISSLHLKKSNP